MRNGNPRLHCYAIFLAIFALAVIVSGAFITSADVAAHQSHAPVAGRAGQVLHRVLAISLAVMTLCIGIWLSLAATPVWLRTVAWIAFAALAAGSALGWLAQPLSAAPATFHASLAHFFFAIVVVVAVVTSSSWNRESNIVDDGGRFLLRPLAIATPPVVFLQTILGAAYRHEAIGIMPHMAGAMVVALATLVVSAVILQNFPGPAPMRRAAAMLISIVLAQVCLGIAAFLMLILNTAGTFAFVLVTVGHVAVGAATLAASVVVAMQIWRNLPPKARPI